MHIKTIIRMPVDESTDYVMGLTREQLKSVMGRFKKALLVENKKPPRIGAVKKKKWVQLKMELE